MKHSNHFYSLGIAIFFLIIAIASAPSKASMDVEHEQVAPDFPGYKGVLLIEYGTKSWTRYAKKYFTTEYKGQIEVVDDSDLKSDRYADKTRYRFMIVEKMSFSNTNGVPSETVNMYDRQTDKIYTTNPSSAFAKLLKNYAGVLEELRSK